jgi:hypothetical protein
MTAAESPDAYVAVLDGWRRDIVEELRAAVREAAPMVEVIKWGHLVYLADGPALLIRAEEERVLFGFWRGRLLRDIEPRIRAGGKYDMGTLELRAGDSIDREVVARLVRRAVEMNAIAGDPRAAALRGRGEVGDSPNP